jgi:hypothetical protein
MIERCATWEIDLSDYLASHANAVHIYGVLDCALFASGAVLVMTGYDPALEFRGKYKTELGAAKALRTIGNGDLESTFDAKLEATPAGFARRGDLVFDGGNVGVCYGAFGFFLGDGNDGLVKIPRSEFVKAWRVG